MVSVIKESRTENNADLVSKPELNQYKSEMKHDFQSLENKMNFDFQSLENRIHKEIAPIRTQMAVMMWTQGLVILTVVVPAIKQMLGL
jgi:hypothetical protein